MVNAEKIGPRDLQFAGTIAQIVHKPKFEFKQQIRNHCAVESGLRGGNWGKILSSQAIV